MDAGTFSVQIENIVGKVLSEELNLHRYPRGADFRTEDFRYWIEMKVRRVKKNNHNTHFSIESPQYKQFVETAQQTFWQPQEDNSIWYKPNLLFLFLKYKFEKSVSNLPYYPKGYPQRNEMEQLLRKNLSLEPGGYLVDHELLEKYVNASKWMNVKTTDLNQIIKERSLEPLTITDFSIPIFPIGENSEELAKRWA